MIRAPFKRKSTPTDSPIPHSRTDRSTSMPRSLSQGSSSVNSLDVNECDSNVYTEIDINTAIVSTNTNNTIAIIDSADTDTNNEIESNVFDSIPSLNLLDSNWSEMNVSQMNLFNMDTGSRETDTHEMNKMELELHWMDVDNSQNDVNSKDNADDRQESNLKEVAECDEIVVEMRHKENIDSGCKSLISVEGSPTPVIEILYDGGYKIPKRIGTLPYANQEVANHLTLEVAQNVYDIDVENDRRHRTGGAIKKTTDLKIGGDAKRSMQPFTFTAKSVNNLFTTIKDKMKKTTVNANAEIFEPIGDADPPSLPADRCTKIRNDNKANDGEDTLNISTTASSIGDKFNDMNLKNRFKQKFKFGFKFAATKKPKLCQRCLRPKTNNIIANRGKDVSAHDSMSTTPTATQISTALMSPAATVTDNNTPYCTCSIDFGYDDGKDHYSDLIGVSILQELNEKLCSCYFFSFHFLFYFIKLAIGYANQFHL